MTFDEAVAFVFQHEGNWSREASDPGGLTRYGISSRAYPAVNLETLTVEQAATIYRKDYWDALQCDALPAPLRLAVFDGAIQHGGRICAKLLQLSLRVQADGAIGPLTLEAARLHPWRDTLVDFLARRAKLYATLPQQAVFGFGWYRRLFALHRHVYATTEVSHA